MSENVAENEGVEGQLYTPKPGEPQFSVRAVLTGCLIGSVVTAMNLYLGLRIGWTLGGSLMAAILSFAAFKAMKPATPFSVLEVNIAQTAGSGAGTMTSAAGLVAAIPALEMLGKEISIWGLFLWAGSIAYLGVMFAVPLRRQYVVIEKLRFPTGTATANTVVSMFATAGEAIAKAKVLIYLAIFSFLYIIASHFIPRMDEPAVGEWLGAASLTSMAAWGFKLKMSPMLFGAGFLIGPRVAISLIAGSLVGWVLLGYFLAQGNGWSTHPNPMVIHDNASDMWGARGWILWSGVAVMVGDALMSLGLSWKTFVTAFKGTKSAVAATGETVVDPEDIPNAWWVYGLALASCATILVAWLVHDIPPYLSILAILLSAVLANVAVRSTGETDINPVGGMGKVTQLAFGPLSSSLTTNLMAAGITGAGASQAGDMMQDLKTGYMLGASPRQQFKAQLWGIAAGVLSAVPVYYLFTKAYEIGSKDLPAPAAIAWKAVAEVMTEGFDALPPFAVTSIFVGLGFGALLPLLKRFVPKSEPYLPSGLSFGIAFIVPSYYSIPMFVGAVCMMAWKKWWSGSCERFVFAVACGLVAGEGLAGIGNAILTILESSNIIPTIGLGR